MSVPGENLQQFMQDAGQVKPDIGIEERAAQLLDDNRTIDEQIDALRSSIQDDTGQDLSDTADAAGKGLSVLEARAEQVLLGIDRSVDNSGVKDTGLRFKFSTMDNPMERSNYLADVLGDDGFSFDKAGNYTVTPRGQARLGLTPLDKDVVLDSPGFEFPEDIADFGGSTGPIAGAIDGAIMGSGAGPIGAIGGAAVGAASGSLLQEGIIEPMGGYNNEDGETLMRRARDEALMGAAGEGIFNFVVKPVAKFMAGPQARRMTPERETLMNQALDMGVLPEASQITDAPIAGYFRKVFNAVFGDPNAARNATAVHARAKSIKDSVALYNTNLSDLGDMVKKNITSARQKLSRESQAMYGQVDTIINGEAFIPTSHLKAAAGEMTKDFAVSKSGEKVLVDDVLHRQIEKILDLPDYITARQMQNMRATLAAAREDNTLMPGIQSYHAKSLMRGVEKGLVEAADSPTVMTPEVKAAANRIRTATARIKDPVAQEKAVRERFEAEVPLRFQAAAAPEVSRMTGVVIKPSDRAVNGARAARALSAANATYKEQIKKFDNFFIQRLARDPKFAGSVDPERMVDAVFRKGQSTNIERLRKVIKPETFNRIRSAAMDDIMGKLVRTTDDPFVDIFDGKRFLDHLDSYGRETLEAMFGAGHVKELYEFGSVVKLMTKGQGAGAGKLVAAGIVARPFQNIGRLARMFTLRSLMNNPTTLGWLTTGIKNPNTREGAKALFRFGTQAIKMAQQHTNDANQATDETAQFRERASALLQKSLSPNQ